MVRGLVRRRLLRALSGTKSAWAWERQPPCFAWRVLAASYKGYAHGRALQHSTGAPIRGLRIPDCAGVGPENSTTFDAIAALSLPDGRYAIIELSKGKFT